MALKQVYDSQGEIPAGLREHYSDREGRWQLDTDPVLEDVSGLKSALSQERTLRRDAEKTASDLKVKFEGFDPEELTKLRERVKGLDDAEVYDKQGIEALVTRRTESMKAEHERVVRLKETELGKLRETLTQTEQRRREERIRTALLEAVTSAGVGEYAIEDAVGRGRGIFNDVDEANNVIAKQGEDVRYGKDGVNPLSPSEWIAELKTSGKARHWWPGSSGGGAPGQHSGNGQGIDYSQYPPEERLTMARAARAAGQR